MPYSSGSRHDFSDIHERLHRLSLLRWHFNLHGMTTDLQGGDAFEVAGDGSFAPMAVAANNQHQNRNQNQSQSQERQMQQQQHLQQHRQRNHNQFAQGVNNHQQHPQQYPPSISPGIPPTSCELFANCRIPKMKNGKSGGQLWVSWLSMSKVCS